MLAANSFYGSTILVKEKFAFFDMKMEWFKCKSRSGSWAEKGWETLVHIIFKIMLIQLFFENAYRNPTYLVAKSIKVESKE